MFNFSADTRPVNANHTKVNGARFKNYTMISTINNGAGIFNYSGLFHLITARASNPALLSSVFQ
ncbi:hypothetical protein [Thalassomonas actiniarum]|uniref:Uncharacterized protein n=1 Tax=Thalassomonas actiniarum TaxID=485447 RepID=A0AAE9YYT7_9GAMM|nr:hypothetical protein [Thalassomonas actiniarum]WDE02132.1 hypothetical protein SG35_030700 [Thalassomonas actiniarum]